MKCARKLDPETQAAVVARREAHTATGIRWSSVIIALIILLVLAVVVALLVLAQDDPDHVVWTGTVVAILVDRTDRVVRRGGHGLHRTDGLVVVEQAGEWANGRHGTFIERNEVTRECWAP